MPTVTLNDARSETIASSPVQYTITPCSPCLQQPNCPVDLTAMVATPSTPATNIQHSNVNSMDNIYPVSPAQDCSLGNHEAMDGVLSTSGFPLVQQHVATAIETDQQTNQKKEWRLPREESVSDDDDIFMQTRKGRHSEAESRTPEEGWTRGTFSLCYHSATTEASFIQYLYQPSQLWSCWTWTAVFVITLPMTFPIFLDTVMSTEAMCTVGLATVLRLFLVIALWKTYFDSKKMDKHEIEIPRSAPQHGRWLYAPPSLFGKMSRLTKIHEWCLVLTSLTILAAGRYQCVARLRLCKHSDPFFCEVQVGTDALVLLYMLLPVFATPVRFIVLFFLQLIVVIGVFALRLPSFDGVVHGVTLNETALASSAPLLNWGRLWEWTPEIILHSNETLKTMNLFSVSRYPQQTLGMALFLMACFCAALRRYTEQQQRDAFERLVALHVQCTQQRALQVVAAGLVGFPMPASLIHQVQRGEVAQIHANKATVALLSLDHYFAFTESHGPVELIHRLHTLFTTFDHVKGAWPAIVKVHTFGDHYLLISGLAGFEACEEGDNFSYQDSEEIPHFGKVGGSAENMESDMGTTCLTSGSNSTLMHDSRSKRRVTGSGGTAATIHGHSSLTEAEEMEWRRAARATMARCARLRQNGANEAEGLLLTVLQMVLALPGGVDVPTASTTLSSSDKNMSPADTVSSNCVDTAPLGRTHTASSSHSKKHAGPCVHALAYLDLPVVVVMDCGEVSSVFRAERSEYVAIGPPIDRVVQRSRLRAENGSHVPSSNRSRSSSAADVTSPRHHGNMMQRRHAPRVVLSDAVRSQLSPPIRHALSLPQQRPSTGGADWEPLASGVEQSVDGARMHSHIRNQVQEQSDCGNSSDESPFPSGRWIVAERWVPESITHSAKGDGSEWPLSVSSTRCCGCWHSVTPDSTCRAGVFGLHLLPDRNEHGNLTVDHTNQRKLSAAVFALPKVANSSTARVAEDSSAFTLSTIPTSAWSVVEIVYWASSCCLYQGKRPLDEEDRELVERGSDGFLTAVGQGANPLLAPPPHVSTSTRLLRSPATAALSFVQQDVARRQQVAHLPRSDGATQQSVMKTATVVSMLERAGRGLWFTDEGFERSYRLYLARISETHNPLWSIVFLACIALMDIILIVTFLYIADDDHKMHFYFVRNYDSPLYRLARNLSTYPVRDSTNLDALPSEALALIIQSVTLGGCLLFIVGYVGTRKMNVPFPYLLTHISFPILGCFAVTSFFFANDRLPPQCETIMWTGLIVFASLARGPVKYPLLHGVMDVLGLSGFVIHSWHAFDFEVQSTNLLQYYTSACLFALMIHNVAVRLVWDRTLRSQFLIHYFSEMTHEQVGRDLTAMKGVLEAMMPSPLALDMLRVAQHRIQQDVQVQRQRNNPSLNAKFNLTGAAIVGFVGRKRNETGRQLNNSHLPPYSFNTDDTHMAVQSKRNGDDEGEDMVQENIWTDLFAQAHHNTVEGAGILFQYRHPAIRAEPTFGAAPRPKAAMMEENELHHTEHHVGTQHLPTYFVTNTTQDTPLLVLHLHRSTESPPQRNLGNSTNHGRSAPALSESLLATLQLWNDIREQLRCFGSELLCWKVTGDAMMVGGRHPTTDRTAIDLMRFAVWASGEQMAAFVESRCPGARLAGALMSGPIRGAVLGSAAVSYEAYGGAASVACSLAADFPTCGPPSTRQQQAREGDDDSSGSSDRIHIVLHERFVQRVAHLLRDTLKRHAALSEAAALDWRDVEDGDLSIPGIR